MQLEMLGVSLGRLVGRSRMPMNPSECVRGAAVLPGSGPDWASQRKWLLALGSGAMRSSVARASRRWGRDVRPEEIDLLPTWLIVRCRRARWEL